MHLMRNGIHNYLFLFVMLLISACSTDYTQNHHEDSHIIDIADIESDPITRLSFVPADNNYNSIEVVIYQDSDMLNDIETASGNEIAEDGKSNKLQNP